MPTIEGTATFEKVDITPIQDEDRIEVFGYYYGDQTGYSAKHAVIDGLRIEPLGKGTITLTPDEDSDDDCVWVTAEETRLVISSEKPPDLD